jgi:transposase-like protein
MTDYEIKLPSELVSSLLSEGNGFAQLLTGVLNQVLEAQATEQIGAGPYERSEGRGGYRNGVRPRTIYTRVGSLTLRVPQFRDGSFSTEIFGRYQRSEQAFVLGLMEMVVNGVSSRKVSKITEELCGASFSKSTVSQLCTGLDARVQAFNERRLGAFPFLIIDAMYIKARSRHDGVTSKAALMVSGVNSEGNREILGVRIGDSESEAFWRDTFDWLKGRGLKDVAFVASDDHKGMGAALKRSFQGAIWQRCQVHFMRNVLSFAGSRHKAAIAEGLKRIFRAETAAEARTKATQLAEAMQGRADRAIQCLEDGLEDALAVHALPAKYHRRLRTTNMQERLIQEVRRRERVIRIFPNEASALRLIGALLAEINEEWQGRKYLDMAEFFEWNRERNAGEKEGKVITI